MAGHLHYTVADLLDSLGDGELETWYQFHKLHPISEPWYQTGLICSTIANFNPWGSKRVFKPDDFMPCEKAKPQDPETIRKRFLVAISAMGKRVIDTRDDNRKDTRG